MSTPPPKDEVTEQPRSKRRWKQFGTRFLLGLLTIVAIISALMTRPMAVSRREALIVKQIKDSGGGVPGHEYQDHVLRPFIPSFIANGIYRRATSVQFGIQQPSADLLQSLSTLTHLRKVSFAEATDGTLASLPAIETLTELDLKDTKVTDASIDVIGKQPNLTTLNCNGTAITDEGLERLSGLLGLENSLVAQKTVQELLRTTECAITVENLDGIRSEIRQRPDASDKVVGFAFPTMPPADAVEKLKSLNHLESIVLSGVAVEPPREIYVALSELTNLKRLTVKIKPDPSSSRFMMFANPAVRSLPGDQVKQLMDEAVEHQKKKWAANTDNLSPIGNLTGLEELELQHGYKTSHSYLENLTNLTRLDVTDIDVNDLAHLENLKNLKTLNVRVLVNSEATGPSATELIARATSVENLSIRMRSLMDSDLKPLTRMPNLKTLGIYGAQVKGPGTEHLKAIANLEKVDIPSLAPGYAKKLQSSLSAASVELVETKRYKTPTKDNPTAYTLKRSKENEKRQRTKLGNGDFEIGREWERHLKIGMACREQANWEDASMSYETGLKQIVDSINDAERDGTAPNPFSELNHELCRSSYVKALIDYDGMRSVEKAVATLETALQPNFSKLPNTTAELLGSAQRAPSNPGNSQNNPYWHTSTNTRMLAYLYEKLGDHSKAYSNWKRYIAIQRATGSGQYWMEPAVLARLRSQALASSQPNTDLENGAEAPSLFLEVGDKPAKFDAKACALATWQVGANDVPFLSLVPPHEQQFDLLAVRVPKGKQVEFCCGGSFKSPQHVLLTAKPHPKLESTYSVRIPYDVDAVFARITPAIAGSETMMLKAKLRTETGEQLPWLGSEELGTPPEQVGPFRYTDCWIVDKDGNRLRAFSRPTNEWGTSLVRLSDGRLLMAFTSNHFGIPNIEFTTSKNGVHWQEPWPFPYNRSRTTDDQLLLLDDGKIWMVFSTFHNYMGRRSVWCTSSSDGHNWIEPELLEFPRFHTLPLEFFRRPNGEFLIMTNHNVGRGLSPIEIREFEKIEPPTGSFGIAGQPRMVFDENNVCHAVGAKGNDIFYWNSQDLEIWSPPQIVAHSTQKGLKVKPRLFIYGDRVALIYRSNNLATIKSGTVTENGIEFEDDEQETESAWLDPHLLRDGDRWLSVIDASNRKLMEMTATDLWPNK